jgi:phosphonate transport system permease protein
MAYNEIQFSTSAIATQVSRVGEIIDDFWPPVWKWPKSLGQPDTFNIVVPFIETLQIAIIGAVTGNLLALPLAFYASRMTAPSNTAYRIAKGFLNVVRTIPDLVWGVLFATAVGFGNPFAGALAMVMFSLAIMAKLLSETVDAIDIGPLEAGRAAGASHSQVIKYAAFPQVRPNFVAYALYIFELNIRASVVIGFVGAGGIGRLLNERRNFFQWDQVMAIVIVIFVAVLLIEWVSIWARRRLV